MAEIPTGQYRLQNTDDEGKVLYARIAPESDDTLPNAVEAVVLEGNEESTIWDIVHAVPGQYVKLHSSNGQDYFLINSGRHAGTDDDDEYNLYAYHDGIKDQRSAVTQAWLFENIKENQEDFEGDDDLWWIIGNGGATDQCLGVSGEDEPVHVWPISYESQNTNIQWRFVPV